MLKNLTDVIGRIKTLQNDLSNFEFGRLLGMTPQTVDLYMRGERKPSVEFVVRVCSHYNVSADWILGLPTTFVAEEQQMTSSVNKRIADLKTSADRATISINNLLTSISKFNEVTK
ncbi:MAG: helix-turn-helix transcriptional regulator [Kiritimatiellae bacterium]|nr:helix-turn-helix transcriptional regulator [Kiritimatiellia bacterium]